MVVVAGEIVTIKLDATHRLAIDQINFRWTATTPLEEASLKNDGCGCVCVLSREEKNPRVSLPREKGVCHEEKRALRDRQKSRIVTRVVFDSRRRKKRRSDQKKKKSNFLCLSATSLARKKKKSLFSLLTWRLPDSKPSSVNNTLSTLSMKENKKEFSCLL